MKRLPLILILILATQFSLAFALQSDYTVRVNYSTIQPQADSLLLQSYFNLLDSSGQIATTGNVDSVLIELQNGSSYMADARRPNTPFFIVLVLDTSGSMGSTSQSMQEAAQNAVSSAPDNAHFTVIGFDDEIRALQSQFTSNQQLTMSAVDDADARPGRGTCLYDAAWQAMDLLQGKPSGRRAVILFTDGVDETPAGNVCSSHTLPQVITRAQEYDALTPFFTIGFEGGGQVMDQGALQGLAQQTQGFFSRVDQQQNLNSAFSYIMEILQSQWFIQATIYPAAGDQIALLTPVLNDGTHAAAGQVRFASDRTYYPPTEFQLSISGLTYDALTKTFNLQLMTSGLTPEIRIEVTVQSNDGLDVIAPIVVSNPAQPIQIPSDQLVGNQDYEIVVSAYDQANAQIVNPITRKFTYNVADAPDFEVSASISGVQPTADGQALEIMYDVQGREQIARLELTIIDNLGLNVPGAVNGQPDKDSSSVRIPLSALKPAASYVAKLQVFDSQNRPLLDEPVTHDFTDPRPEQALQMRIAGVDLDDMTIRLVYANVSEVAQLEVMIMSSQGLVTQETRQFTGVSDAIPITAKLSRGQSYTIQVMPRDAIGTNLLDALVEHQFDYPEENISLLTRITNIIASPLPLGLCLSVAILGGVFVWLRWRGEKQAQELANSADDELADRGTIFFTADSNSPAPYLSQRSHSTSSTASRRTSSRRTPTWPESSPTETDPNTTVVLKSVERPTLTGVPSAYLYVRQSRTDGMVDYKMPVKPVRNIIGRDLNADLSFLQDPSVSRSHLNLRYSLSNRCYEVEVLSPHEGFTRINKEMVAPGEIIYLPNDQMVRFEIGNLKYPERTVIIDFEVEAR
ncbi:MAG: VWA domain-containing protein [Anaerolineae bacterium]|nr:VWA domain-containing protein [Anaerolineae bacterium]